MDEHIKSLKDEEKAQNEAFDFDEKPKKSPKRFDGNALCGGLALVTIGGLFLLHNLTGFTFNNWWVIFLLFPAFGNLSKVARSMARHGRLTRKASHSLVGGLAMLTIAFTFLFGWSWAFIWPLFLVFAGLGAILNGRFA